VSGFFGAMSEQYYAFRTKMQHPSAANLLLAMKEFIREHQQDTGRSADELSEAVQTFFQQTEDALIQHPLWADCDPEELEKMCDNVEKFVMTRLHDRAFAVEAEELAEEARLSEWMRLLHFISPDHLGISKPFQDLAPWADAQMELCKIVSYKTPRDKLVCILNCCKRINGSLSQSTSGTHGADEFFPILIYVLLQSDTPQLHSNLRYISRFRHPSKLVSEAAYYLTSTDSVP
jgi:Rab5 GDP/GTP exchange factor